MQTKKEIIDAYKKSENDTGSNRSFDRKNQSSH